VIRTEQDHGTVWLLDDRFARVDVQRLLPAWWTAPRTAPNTPDL
jgi:Rad3-related DNA helicase